MPPVPPDQRSPYGPNDNERRWRDTRSPYIDATYDPHAPRGPPAGASPHLTMKELADRWKRKPKTVERHYAEWGLIPLRFGGRLLFPIEQVLEVERHAMRGEFVSSGHTA